MPNLARAGSLNGAGVTYGSYVSSNLQAWQQPVLPAGANTVTLTSPWPHLPNATAPSAVPTITVTGGTVSSITIGGGSSVGTSGTFNLTNPVVVIAYTVAPTVSFALAPWFQTGGAKTAVST